MDVKLPAGWRELGTNDVGTLWIMRYADHRARCALMACPSNEWELRVIVDGHLVLSERCARGQAAFALAQDWQEKMIAVGWRRIPRFGRQSAPAAETRRVLVPRFVN